jgi:hypothetical protein
VVGKCRDISVALYVVFLFSFWQWCLPVQQFFAGKNMVVLLHPRYFLGFVPCHFFLFPIMKSLLKGCSFQDVSEIQEQSLTGIHWIPKCQFQQRQKPIE